MKSHRIAFVAPGIAALEEHELQTALSPGHALLKTDCTLISTGTERANLMGGNNLGSPGPAKFPRYLGYSAVAEVMALADDVHELRVGDRVAVYHSQHAQYLVKHCRDLVRIEDEALPSAEAVFCIVAAMGLQGLRKLRLELGESCLVMGQGLLGAFALQCARLSGALPLLAMDFVAERRERACRFGADAAWSPDDPALSDAIRQLTDGRGVNTVIEVTGSPAAVKQGLKLMAPQGRIALVGCSRTPTEQIDFYNDVHRPGIVIIGAHNFVRPKNESFPGYWTMRDDMRMLLRFIAAGRIQVRPLLRELVSPHDAPAVFTRLAQNDPTVMGTIFDWKRC